ncbi:ribonuclease III [Patescibacteria group bacterium]|nr:MAG: ribonuclease III [Patescibacteria group bacterium]
MEKDFGKLEKKLKIEFKNHNLLKQAFVHRSYLNENKNFPLDQNERLEFLGDAVLELVVTEYLYCNYSNPEGELTNWRAALVKGEMLADVAHKLNYEKYLYLSRGEAKGSDKARRLILANTFEAVLGAIYLDRGFKTCEKFLEKNLLLHLPEILKQEAYLDAKTKLQEYFQNKSGLTPEYIVIKETGPDHKRYFEMGVRIGGKELAKGRGSSKQAAEQDAAQEALQKLKI